MGNATKAGKTKAYTLDEFGNADRFIDSELERIRYVPGSGWWFFDGQRWMHDLESRRVKAAARAVLSSIKDGADALPKDEDGDSDLAKAILQWHRRSQTAGAVRSVLEVAKVAPAVTATGEDFDSDPFLLNVQNGIVDLRTKERQKHRADAMCSHITNARYLKNASAPQWRAFIDWLTCGDKDLAEFLQRLAGYALSGSSKMQRLFLLIGSGANGKSTFSETLRDVFGTYARSAEFRTFVQDRNHAVRNDIVRFRGARTVIASESNHGERLDEAVVKQLTGGDTVVARQLYRDYEEFRLAGTILLSANHLPEIQGTDYGIWRRIQVVPFNARLTPSQIDPSLGDKLRGEADGILRWAIDGCAKWAADERLDPSAAVVEATNAFRRSADPFGAFLRESCFVDPAAKVDAAVLHRAHDVWVRQHGVAPMTMSAFSRAMTARNIKRGRAANVRWYEGIGLRGAARTLDLTENASHASST